MRGRGGDMRAEVGYEQRRWDVGGEGAGVSNKRSGWGGGVFYLAILFRKRIVE